MPDIVQFKRGQFNTLMSMKTNSSLQKGTFYYAYDASRLYLAESSSELADLNQFIHFVDTRIKQAGDTTHTALPITGVHNGDIYYIVDENILCTWNESKSGDPGHWVQINPDTAVAAFTVSVSADNLEPTKKAHVSSTVEDSGSFSQTREFIIAGGQNITVASDTATNTITISAADQSTNTEYDLGASSTNGTVSINLTERVPQGQTPEVDSVIIAADSNSDLTVTASGNTITIGGVNQVNSVTNAFDSQGNFTTTIDNAENTLGVTSTAIAPTISYGQGYNNNPVLTAKFLSGTASLAVYTKDEIDDLFEDNLATANAMTYKGTLTTSNISTIGAHGQDNNTFNAQVGDTYKVSAEDGLDIPTSWTTGDTVHADNGDLVIASGRDGSVHWEIVPSGDDQLLEFSANAGSSTPSLTVTDNRDSSEIIGGIKFIADSTSGASVITYSATATHDGSELDIQIQHGSAGTGTAVVYATATNANNQIQTTGTQISIPTIASISKDRHGHIVDIVAKTFTLEDTHATFATPTYGVNAINDTTNNISYTRYDTILGLDGGNTSQATVSLGLTSDNLTITNASTTAVTTTDGSGTTLPIIKMNLEWGTF